MHRYTGCYRVYNILCKKCLVFVTVDFLFFTLQQNSFISNDDEVKVKHVPFLIISLCFLFLFRNFAYLIRRTFVLHNSVMNSHMSWILT